MLGPTATGKTRLGVALARRFGGEIVSADSRQVYRGMDIGTGKDLDDFVVGGPVVPHHLLDVVEPTEEYHLFRYLREARTAVRDIAARNRLPVVVGGTALYLNGLLDGYALQEAPPDPEFRTAVQNVETGRLAEMLREQDPALHSRTDLTQRRRVIRALEIAGAHPADHPPPCPLHALLLGPFFPRPAIHRRIEKRLDARLSHGMLDEVRRLLDAGVTYERLEFFGLEYRYAARHLRGLLTRDQFRDTLLARIRRFCKAQEIWFRKMEREGKLIHWIPHGDPDLAADLVARFLDHQALPPPTRRLIDTLYGPQTNP